MTECIVCTLFLIKKANSSASEEEFLSFFSNLQYKRNNVYNVYVSWDLNDVEAYVYCPTPLCTAPPLCELPRPSVYCPTPLCTAPPLYFRITSESRLDEMPSNLNNSFLSKISPNKNVRILRIFGAFVRMRNFIHIGLIS